MRETRSDNTPRYVRTRVSEHYHWIAATNALHALSILYIFRNDDECMPEWGKCNGEWNKRGVCGSWLDLVRWRGGVDGEEEGKSNIPWW